jgi:diguanylate cyclase (GGDEF)-like protein
MTPAKRQLVHAIANLTTFACALAAVVIVPLAVHERWSSPVLVLTIVASLVVAIVALNGLPVRGLRIRRGDFSSEALFQDAPVEIPIFILVTPEAAAVSVLAGFLLASAMREAAGRLDLLRQGAVRALLILALAPLRPGLIDLILGPWGAFWFLFLGALAALFVVFVCSMPFVAIHTSLPLTTIWQRLAKDRRLWAGLFATVFWAYVIVRLVTPGESGAAAMIALWLPVVAYSWLLRRVDDQAVELHRLRLVRDAVQAMLGSRDPLPQINAILSSIHGTLLDETISIVTANSASVDDWRVVASLGQAPTSADLELRRRTLTRLKFAGMPSVVLEGDYATMHAFGIRLTDEDDLLGALIVRRRGSPIPEPGQRQYVDAARGIAPLLRDIRSIAAQQSAATTDGLTGLKNRAAIFEQLRGMLTDVVRSGAVLILDIDHFKRVNDELGHPAGDACLRRIAELASAAIRAGDSVGRIGGEEFLIVMPAATSDSAMMVGERLRLAISLSGLRHASGDPITASLGVAAAASGDTAETLVARADRALYEAKRTGRNRIVEGIAESA